MIFRSNIAAPDLSQHFKLRVEERGHSFHHDCPSDPDFEPDCTFWTHDEAAILWQVAGLLGGRSMGGRWLDIGARFGWTSAHIAAAGSLVEPLDPQLKYQDRAERFEANLEHCWHHVREVHHKTSREVLARLLTRFDGFVIDGCHDAPEPLEDAVGCAKLAKPTAVIMFHDFYGQPVREAVTRLLEEGWHARIYWTPNGVACCWRGDFMPPIHYGDIRIGFAMGGRFPDFDFVRCE